MSIRSTALFLLAFGFGSFANPVQAGPIKAGKAIEDQGRADYGKSQCGGDSCLRGGQADVEMPEGAVIIDSDIVTSMTVKRRTVELEPLDVTLPTVPYGVEGAGTCLLRFNLLPTGRPESLNITNCPDAYAAALRKAAPSWRFHPFRDANGDAAMLKRVSWMIPWQADYITLPG